VQKDCSKECRDKVVSQQMMWGEMTVDDRLLYLRGLVHAMAARLKDTTVLDSCMLNELMKITAKEDKESMPRKFFPNRFPEGAVPLGAVRCGSCGQAISSREGGT
jgi:hypothetical protein